MNSILIIVLAFSILIIIHNIINNRTGINNIMNHHFNNEWTKSVNTGIRKKNEINKHIDDNLKIKTKYIDPFYNFPDPMLSNISHPLSAGYKPLFNDNDEPNMDNLDIVRKSTLDYYFNDPKVFNPSLVSKDTMDANPGNHTLQGLAKIWDGKETKIDMTSDEYLTKYPVYADNNFTNELTNTGFLFDNQDNNKYINLKNKILPSNCKINDNNLSCEFNNKLQPIPDKLMKNNSAVLNSIGVLVDNIELVQSTNGYQYGNIDGDNYKIWNYPNEKVMNGGVDFNSVYGSNAMGTNETFMTVTDNLKCSSCAI